MKTAKKIFSTVLSFLMIFSLIPITTFAVEDRGVTPEVGKVIIPFQKTWDDNDNQEGFRPDSIDVTLYKYTGEFNASTATPVESKTVTAEEDWGYNFDVSNQDVLDSNGTSYKWKIVESEVPMYHETVHTDPNVVFTPMAPGTSWDRITPCSQLNITTTGNYKSVVVAKKGSKYIIWTVDALSEPERRAIFESAKANLQGFGGGTYDDATFISGIGGSYGGMTVTFENITFDDPSNWSFFGTGFYEKSSTEANGSAITNTRTPEIVSVSGTKTWNDADNQDGKRPESITVNLLKNGAVAETKTVTANDNWSWNFGNLPKYENGTANTYVVTEETVAGYTTTYDGYNITNSYTPEETSVSVSKAWKDDDNRDGVRANAVTVRLLADGEPVSDKILTLTEANGWQGSFTGLPVYKNGAKISYTVSEDEVAPYTTKITGNPKEGFVITNTHEPEKIEISGTKTWNDADNQDGKRPANITVKLLKNGQTVAERTVTANDGWKWTFENLPKYENGTEINYSITENAVPEYSTEINGFDITNTYTPKKTSVAVTKVWNDANNQDGLRANAVTVNLLADGEVVGGKTLTLTGDNNWAGTFENLPMYNKGKKIVYTVSEVNLEGYTTKVTGDATKGFVITNTHDPIKIEMSGEKIWNDANDQDGKRPPSITVELMKGNEVVQTKTVTAADGWKWTFTDLDLNENGELINYVVREQAVDGYTTDYEGTGLIVNSYTPEKTNVHVLKDWNDKNNQDSIRPENVAVQLFADGEAVEGKILVLSAENQWSGNFTDLDKYSGGKEIKYTVSEEAVEGYVTEILENDSGFVITNTHVPAVTSVSGEKTWDDADNQDGKRPDEIIVNLLKNGNVIQTKTVTAADGWKWTFDNLDKFDKGTEIVYSITEKAVEGYSTSYAGFNIINKYTPKKTSVSVAKTWNDVNNQDGIRPENITVQLMADGAAVEGKTLELNAENQWTGSFTELDKYKKGKEINYTVKEVKVDGYTTQITGSAENGYKIINTHVPAVTSVSGTKTWDDADNQDGKRPDEITVNLLKNGNVIQTKTVTAADGWKWTFDNLPKFENGNVITYTVEENTVAGYETSYNGFNIVNKHVPEKTQVDVNKAWNDADNQDGMRPEEITVQLMADGKAVSGKTIKLNAQNQWTGGFDNLDKYKDGKEIAYTVKEVKVDSYTTEITGNAKDGFTITNTHKPEVVSVTGTKKWNDANNQDGIRPASITLQLVADGEAVDGKTIELNAQNQWTGTFAKLDKYKDGKEIVYTVAEIKVEGYETTVTGNAKDGFTITNTHVPAVIAISGSKTWDDADNQDGKRPESITINLIKNGQVVDTRVVTEADDWSWTFEDLDKFEAGHEIQYSIIEEATGEYSAEYDGFDVVNKYTPKMTSVSVVKNWNDANDKDKIRPDYVEVQLFADGKPVEGMMIRLSAKENWTGSFTELPEYKDGKKIVYTVSEVEVKGYVTEVAGDAESGFVITNTHTPAPNTPKTGDTSGVTEAAMLFISALMLAGALSYRRKEEE